MLNITLKKEIINLYISINVLLKIHLVLARIGSAFWLYSFFKFKKKSLQTMLARPRRRPTVAAEHQRCGRTLDAALGHCVGHHAGVVAYI